MQKWLKAKREQRQRKWYFAVCNDDCPARFDRVMHWIETGKNPYYAKNGNPKELDDQIKAYKAEIAAWGKGV